MMPHKSKTRGFIGPLQPQHDFYLLHPLLHRFLFSFSNSVVIHPLKGGKWSWEGVGE